MLGSGATPQAFHRHHVFEPFGRERLRIGVAFGSSVDGLVLSQAWYANGGGITSDWLKNGVRTSLQRDPLDAVNDAEELAEFLAWHAKEQAAMALFEMAQRVALRGEGG